MNAPTVKHQIIRGADGTPEYVVVPYNEYLELAQTADPILDATIPLAVSEATYCTVNQCSGHGANIKT